MASSLTTLSGTVLLTGLFALVPDEAGACSYPCYGLPYFTNVDPVNAAAIPIDGVLVLRATGSELEDPDLIASLELVVTRDGQPIAGAVEATPSVGILVWRPSLPLEPGAHAVHTSFTNANNDYAGCGPDGGESDFEFLVEDAPSQPLVPPAVAHEQSILVSNSDELKDLACCDAAFPQEGYGGCGAEYGTYWEEGECAPTRATGFLRIELTAQSMQNPSTSGLLLTSFLVDGVPTTIGLIDQVSPSLDHPFCTQVELLNLGTGETSISEQVCHGEDVADQLGPQIVDPTIELAGKCDGPLYTCAILDEFPRRWDPAACTPLEAEETTDGPTSSDSQSATDSDPTTGPGSDTAPTSNTAPTSDTTPTSDTEAGSDTAPTSGDQDGLIDHGCACDSGPGDRSTLLGLLGLGLLARRRRR